MKAMQTFVTILCMAYITSTASYAAMQCEGVTLTLEDESARAFLAIVDGQGDKKTIDAALNLHGASVLVRKTKELGYDKSLDDLRRDLRTIQSGDRIEKDYFGLNRLKAQAAEAQALLTILDESSEDIIKGVCDKMRPFLPADYQADIGIEILAGGYATGFTFDDEPVFYMAAQRIGKDAPGLELITVHELFHVVQAMRSPWKLPDIQAQRDADPKGAHVREFLYSGYLEGGATYVANPDAYSGEGPTVKFFKDAKADNVKNLRRLFITFDAYLYRLAHDEEADYDAIYAAGFYDDGPLYFVGAYMAEKLEQAYGQAHIKKLLDEPPTRFFMDYLELCAKNEKLLCLSQASRNIIHSYHVEGNAP